MHSAERLCRCKRQLRKSALLSCKPPLSSRWQLFGKSRVQLPLAPCGALVAGFLKLWQAMLAKHMIRMLGWKRSSPFHRS